MKRITSRQNAMVAAFRDAARGEAAGVMLLDGAHLVGEALAAGVRIERALVATAAAHRPEIASLVERLTHREVDLAEASPTVMDAASPVRSSSPIVALAARPVGLHAVVAAPAPLLVVIACDVQDPGNLGAIVRVAEGAGASGVIVAGQSADPFGWKALRGSMGSALRLPMATVPRAGDAVDLARAGGMRVAATVPRGGVSPFEADLTRPTALLIGTEGIGLTGELIDTADVRLTIPMQAPVESLNAAVAAAVLLYEARRQRTLATAAR